MHKQRDVDSSIQIQDYHSSLKEGGTRQYGVDVGSRQISDDEVEETDEYGNPCSPRHKSIQLGRYDKFLRWMNTKWAFELLSWTLSAACLVWIFLVLYFRQDKSLPSWPFAITINALISILSAIMKTSLLLPVEVAIGQLKWNWFQTRNRPLIDFETYDSATRGPWGSVSLLLRDKGRHLASLGATITILSLALDVMFQQIITYETRNSQTGGFTTIKSTLLYDPDVEGGIYSKVPDMVRAASYTALYFSGNFSNAFQASMLYPQVECASGNCSYPIFDSLAVCNVCTNVTDDLQVFIDDPPGTSRSSVFLGSANYTLPNGFSTGWMNSSRTRPGYISSGRVSSTVRVRAPFPILNFTQVTFNPNSTGIPTATATECALHWCVNRYKTFVKAGVLSEEVISSNTASGPEVMQFYSIRGPPNTNISLSLWNDNTSGWGNPTGSYPCGRIQVDPAYCPTSNGKTALKQIDGAGLVGLEASKHLGSYLGDLLTGYSSLVLNTGAEIQPMSYNESDVVRRLHRTDNATLSMDILARSLTTAIREYVRSRATGHVIINGWNWKSEVHVRVRWPWMTLPVLLEISTLGFLLITIWATHSAKTDLWKNSSLAVLFHGGLKKDVVATNSEFRDAIAMEKIARKKNVRLKDVGDGRIELD